MVKHLPPSVHKEPQASVSEQGEQLLCLMGRGPAEQLLWCRSDDHINSYGISGMVGLERPH